uniref:Bestrophin homolog n=1 Tax=Romanomermis culicivorax TaxID=13658 RepID=A0A915ISC2_ROMCU
MTVTYTGSFMRVLFRWKGSLWKGVVKQFVVWLTCYYAIRLFLHYGINDKQGLHSMIKMFDGFTNRIPLQFLLGFYVVQTVTRWWAQVQAMPWPDDLMSNINAMFYENDDETKQKRRTIGRYIILSFILAWRRVSTAVQAKFPTLECLMECGLLQAEERDILVKAPHSDSEWDYPLNWIYEVVRKKLGNQFSFVKELNTIRGNFRTLFNYNNICVPLVYTQTATVAVYGYFTLCLIEFDLAFPFLTALQFIFSVGWLNVAEDLFKPFGNDDDDIEIVNYLERHTRFIKSALEAPDNLPLDSMSRESQEVNIDALFGVEETVNLKKTALRRRFMKKKDTLNSIGLTQNPVAA